MLSFGEWTETWTSQLAIRAKHITGVKAMSEQVTRVPFPGTIPQSGLQSWVDPTCGLLEGHAVDAACPGHPSKAADGTSLQSLSRSGQPLDRRPSGERQAGNLKCKGGNQAAKPRHTEEISPSLHFFASASLLPTPPNGLAPSKGQDIRIRLRCL